MSDLKLSPDHFPHHEDEEALNLQRDWTREEETRAKRKWVPLRTD